MATNEFIAFRRKRDFSEKLNTTFAFVRLNFKALMHAMIFIAGPPVLVASLMLSSFMGDMFKMVIGAAQNPTLFEDYLLSANFWIQIVLMFVFMVISYIAVISVTLNFMMIYNEKQGGPVDVNEVWDRVRSTMGMYVSTSLLFGLLAIGAYALLIIPVAILGAIAPVLMVLGVFAYVFALIYLMISCSLIYVVRAVEDIGFLDGLARSFRLVSGKWWSTFGLLFVLSLMVGIISYIFSIPASMLQGISALHDVESGEIQQSTGVMASIIFILNALAYLCQLLFYFLPNIGLAFQYFNLVELKESKGLLTEIETLGQPKAQTRDEDHY